MRVGPNPVQPAGVLTGERMAARKRQKRSNAWDYQKLQEIRRDPALEVSGVGLP